MMLVAMFSFAVFRSEHCFVKQQTEPLKSGKLCIFLNGHQGLSNYFACMCI